MESTELKRLIEGYIPTSRTGKQILTIWRHLLGFICLFVCVCVFWNRASLCSPGWPWTHKDLPNSAFWVLKLKMWVIIPNNPYSFHNSEFAYWSSILSNINYKSLGYFNSFNLCVWSLAYKQFWYHANIIWMEMRQNIPIQINTCKIHFKKHKHFIILLDLSFICF